MAACWRALFLAILNDITPHNVSWRRAFAAGSFNNALFCCALARSSLSCRDKRW